MTPGLESDAEQQSLKFVHCENLIQNKFMDECC